MFAVSSVDAAKLYYESFKTLQEGRSNPLKIATIFSFAANEEQDAIGNIQDESFDVSAMNSSSKEFLAAAIADYNALFKTSYSVDSKSFQNYYRDLAKRVRNQEIDLLIVVGMFLTGFDAPALNTLFVDKNLRYHGLIQAYSRTNRILDAPKRSQYRHFPRSGTGNDQCHHAVRQGKHQKYTAGKELQGIHGRLYRFVDR